MHGVRFDLLIWIWYIIHDSKSGVRYLLFLYLTTLNQIKLNSEILKGQPKVLNRLLVFAVKTGKQSTLVLLPNNVPHKLAYWRDWHLWCPERIEPNNKALLSTHYALVSELTHWDVVDTYIKEVMMHAQKKEKKILS